MNPRDVSGRAEDEGHGTVTVVLPVRARTGRKEVSILGEISRLLGDSYLSVPTCTTVWQMIT